MNSQKNREKILIVDDEINALKVLSAILSEQGYEVIESLDGDRAIQVLNRCVPDAVITDIKMPGIDGMHVFDYIHEYHPDIPVIFLSAYGTIDSAVQAMTTGAFYFFSKPPDYHKLKGIVSMAVEQRRLKKEVEFLKQRLSGSSEYDNGCHLIGNSHKFNDLLNKIHAIRDSQCSVLITGETGTGKELVAKALAGCGGRNAAPFVAVNCAAIPRELIEAEIFGYEKGAFTGASSRRIGKFEKANGGVLFLDEIGELEIKLQAKLLRVLQEKEIERVGSNEKIHVDFRLICSTNRNLKDEIKAGRFREDLFYRVNVFHITVPPLRQRREDIPLLVSKFLQDFCKRESKTVTIDEKVLKLLTEYSWPGNVRQLRNVVESAVVMSNNRIIGIADLPEELRSSKPKILSDEIIPLKNLENQAIKSALSLYQGNKSKAAKALGISRKALYSRLAELQIEGFVSPSCA
ncbi:MAG: sigma-54-dependent Fis family transcriptional regulator [Desulfobacteraceae bacterium]|nr:MAG: sigma-54-dependent Fis family transcriptional regulator [Desulfobacteraceae bacterium]